MRESSLNRHSEESRDEESLFSSMSEFATRRFPAFLEVGYDNELWGATGRTLCLP
jgi:hypothetical protein